MKITRFHATIFLIFSLAVAFGWYLLKDQLPGAESIRYTDDGFVKLSKEERMNRSFELEFEKTRDLTTNEVPRDRLLAAAQYTQELLADAALSRSDYNFKWEERGPNNVSGRTRALIVDLSDPSGNTIWTGGVAGGIWKTSNMLDDRPFWEPIGDFYENMAIASLAQDPVKHNIMYAGTGEGFNNADAVRGLGVFKTTDSGQNWELIASTRNGNFHYVNRLAVNADGHVFAATNTGIFYSENTGETWTKVLNGRVGDLRIATDGLIYAGVYNTGIFRFETGQSGSWERLSNGFPANGYSRVELAICENSPNVLYTTLAGPGGNVMGIYRSEDRGDTWEPRAVPGAFGMDNYARGQAWYDLTVGVDPNNPNRVFIGGIDILVSSNGGQSWNQISQWFGGGGYQYTHADQHNIVFQPGSSNIIYFTNDGGVFRTTNGASASPVVRFVSDGYNVTQFYACAIHPEEGRDWFLAGAQDNGTQLFREEGMNNTFEVTGGDGAFVHIDELNPNIQISSYIYNAYRITNTAWEQGFTSRNIGNNDGFFINPTDYDSKSKTLYGSYKDGMYSMVRDVGGDNIVDSASLLQSRFLQVSAVLVAPNTDNRVYFGTSGGTVIVMDNANSAEASSRIIRSGSGFVSSIAVEDGNEDHIVVTYSNYGSAKIFETKNGGVNWTNISGNLPDIPVRWAVFSPKDPNQVLIATELGVWMTEGVNGTLTQWFPTESGLANTRVDMLQFRKSDNFLIAATHGRGLYSSQFFVQERAVIRTEQRISYVNYPISFNDKSIGEFDSRTWDFGDGNTSTALNPVHSYQDTGTYVVSLNLRDDITTSINIKILPNKSTPFAPNETGYSGSFENNQGDFAAFSISGSSFSLGKSTFNGKSGARSGNFAWVLDIDQPIYQPNSISTIYTPMYDFTEEGIYEISFWAKYDINPSDGFQLQYTLDGGSSWLTVGDLRSGWYNYSIDNNTGAFEINEPYFSGRQASFKEFKYNVTDLGGLGQVAFRFLFRSQAIGSFPGVVIDDFSIHKFTGDLLTNIIDIQGTYTNNRRLKLNWKTRPEYFCQGFRVELSQNGWDFDSIGYVSANQFSVELKDYEFITQTERNRDLYFLRLYVINDSNDGRYSNNFYSKTVVIRKNLSGLELFDAYPTLASDFVNLIFTDVVDQPVNIQVFSSNGKQVVSQEQNPGAGFYRLDLPQLPPGVYFVLVEIPGTEYRKTLKIVISS